jgi:hypothetical protein
VQHVRRAHLVAAIGSPCAYCGEPMAAPTRDHIRPRSKGGTLAQGKALACAPCNTDKGSRSLASWLYRLKMVGDPRAPIVAAFITGLATAASLALAPNRPGHCCSETGPAPAASLESWGGRFARCKNVTF